MVSVEVRKISMLDVPELIILGNNDDHYGIKVKLIVESFINSEDSLKSCFVAISDRSIVGFVYGFLTDNSTLFPQFLYVKPEYRKKGIGTKLMKTIETETECSVSIIYYHNSLHNYYKRQGYNSGDQLEVAIKEVQCNKDGAQL